ncbi:uncharacterized protein LOC144582954 isoform X1 [Callithrix jacchus]
MGPRRESRHELVPLPPSQYGGLSPWLDTCPPSVPPDSYPGGRLALGLSPGQRSSSRCPALGALKPRPFLVPRSPALSCVSSSTQVGPPDIDRHRSLFGGSERTGYPASVTGQCSAWISSLGPTEDERP